MPAVSVMPGLGGFGSVDLGKRTSAFRENGQQVRAISTMQNGIGMSYDGMNAAGIKEQARESVNRETRGASPLSLIKTARSQYHLGRESEGRGEFKNSLASYFKAAALAKLAIESPENESGGVIWKEINEFFDRHANDLSERVKKVEEKVKTFDQSHPIISVPANGSTVNPGSGITDRVKALRDSGLDVTSKRYSHNLTVAVPPIPLKEHSLSSPSPIPWTPPSALKSPTPGSSTPSPHTLVSPSQLGPPSPSSTPTSSPQLNAYNGSEFTSFPSIEELDELQDFSLRSAPVGVKEQPTHSKDVRNTESYIASSSTSTASRAPFRPLPRPIERPSSTPILPVINTLGGLPGSPTKSSIPLKSSDLSAHSSSIPIKPINGRPIIPVTHVATPRELSTYLTYHNVLLLDVRSRIDFEREHIKTEAVACIEPSDLRRKDLTIEQLEGLMSAAPKNEQSLFSNRDKFDLVVVYDESSTELGGHDTPLSVLVRLIDRPSIQKMLKRAPMLLVGGLRMWRQESGEVGIVQGVSAPDLQRPSYSNSPAPVSLGSYSPDPHQLWIPRAHADPGTAVTDRVRMNGFDRNPYHIRLALFTSILELGLIRTRSSRSPAEVTHPMNLQSPDRSLTPAPPRMSNISYMRSIDNLGSPGFPATPFMNGSSALVSYPQFQTRTLPSTSSSGALIPSNLTSPPQASINPSQLSRRRTDYVDQSQEALSNFHFRTSVDYPSLSVTPVLRPPPVAAPSALERQDNRPRLQRAPTAPPANPPSEVANWLDWRPNMEIRRRGLKNLGNTCWMNSTLQCLNATVPFANFYLEGRWKFLIKNDPSPRGEFTRAYAYLLSNMRNNDPNFYIPQAFYNTLCQFKPQFRGQTQHDSQEFLGILLDELDEDLKQEVELVKPEYSTPRNASGKSLHVGRGGKSIIANYFQSECSSRLQCLTCYKTSTTSENLQFLQLSIPQIRSGRVSLQICLDEFFKDETLDSDEKWHCPDCKEKRRTSKKVSLTRPPAILIIHLKRFSNTDSDTVKKNNTLVSFPMHSLDLTSYMSSPEQPKGPLKVSEEPPMPCVYNLYGVTNHRGALDSGHYTALISSSGSWFSHSDTNVEPIDSRQVVSSEAYVLFYKRVKP